MFSPAPIAHDLACRKCRYNLRTLAADGVCPECANPVQDSLDHQRLIAATDFRRLAWGAAALALLAFLGTFHFAYFQPMYGRWEFIRYYVPIGIDLFLDNVLPWAHALAFPPLLLLGVILLATSRTPDRRSLWPARLVLLCAFLYTLPTAAAFLAFLRGYLHRAADQPLMGMDTLFVHLETSDAFGDKFLERWQWTILPLYLLFFALLISGAYFLHTLLRRVDYPRVARATFLVFASALILPLVDLLGLALVYVLVSIAAIRDDEATMRSSARILFDLQPYLDLSFYLPMLVYWLTLGILFRRLQRTHRRRQPMPA